MWYIFSLLSFSLSFILQARNLTSGFQITVEWANWSGRVNSVSPGYIDTAILRDCPFEMEETWFELTPLRRAADPGN